MSSDLAAIGGLLILGAFLVAVALFAFTVWAFVDALRRPRQQWDVAGQQQTTWALVIGIGALVGVGPVAALLYVLIPLPRLQAAVRATRPA